MAEHGTLGLSSPWCRAAFTDEERREISALIPAGYSIYISGDAHFGGRRFTLHGRDGEYQSLIVLSARYDPVEAARQIARRLADFVPVTVTTDAQGYVASIEATDAR